MYKIAIAQKDRNISKMYFCDDKCQKHLKQNDLVSYIIT